VAPWVSAAPEVSREPRRAGTGASDNVPASLRIVDYWQAMNYFSVFDSQRRGFLDKNCFFKLLTAVTRGREPMTKPYSDALFEAVDLDDSGTIDCGEYLGWVFATHSNYSQGIRKRLASMDPGKVIEFYKNITKTNRHGDCINKVEFAEFMNKFCPESAMSREATDELFGFIDIDRSGSIDVKEFLAWINPDAKASDAKRRISGASTGSLPAADAVVSRKTGGLMRGLTQQPQSSPSNQPSGASPAFMAGQKKTALFEMPPSKSVPLEFTCGQDSGAIAMQIKRTLEKVFGDAVEMKILQDPTCKGVRKLSVHVGRGIVIWDRYTMVSHMDDPFVSVKSAENWVLTILMQAIQLLVLLGAVDVFVSCC
ncbi:unnamed protein product, partial [Polarella glacialis]